MRIVCPDRNNAVAFINRKQFYSVNVQAVCDSNALITNIVARWPGVTHDSRIFDNFAMDPSMASLLVIVDMHADPTL